MGLIHLLGDHSDLRSLAWMGATLVRQVYQRVHNESGSAVLDPGSMVFNRESQKVVSGFGEGERDGHVPGRGWLVGRLGSGGRGLSSHCKVGGTLEAL